MSAQRIYRQQQPLLASATLLARYAAAMAQDVSPADFRCHAIAAADMLPPLLIRASATLLFACLLLLSLRHYA